MQRNTGTALIAAGIAAVLLLGVTVAQQRGRNAPDPGAQADPVANGGPLRVRLSAGTATGVTPVANVASGTPLSRERIEQILARLPEFATDEGDRRDLNLPTASLRPPIVSTTTDVAFPPPDAGGSAPDDPDVLEVVRHQPDGDVAVAPYLSVTFNQDVIPLATLEQLDAREAPVRVTPELPGRWRWIGTRTLRYEHAGGTDGVDRLPAATTYTVEIPAGTTSVDGDALAQAFTWTFRTPAATVTSFQPTGDSLPLEPVFVATFDQRVDPAAVLATVQLQAGERTVPVRPATAAEIDADDGARQAMAQSLDGRAVAFRAVGPLPADSSVAIDVGPGTPSAEGPRTTDEAQRFRGRTYGRFRLLRSDCGYGQGCVPGAPFILFFSNPIDAASLDRADIDIAPPLPGATVQVFGADVVIQGATAANTTYRVAIPGDLRDEHGQTLGDGATASFRVGEALPRLDAFANELTTADPYARSPATSVVSVAHDQLRVRLFEVTPDDWPAYLRWADGRHEEHFAEANVPWPQLVDRIIDTGAGRDGLPVETLIDLAEAIDGSTGHVVVLVTTTTTYPRATNDFWNNRPAVTWVQATALGIDAFADRQRLVSWVTDLRDGSPVSGVEISAGSDRATTDRFGLATSALGKGDHLIARLGDDSVILSARYSGPWEAYATADPLRWFVIDDRGLYRPGETVHLKGVVRRIRLDAGASVVAVGGDPSVRYRVTDALGVDIAQGTTAVSGLGTFDLAIELPEGTNLGDAWVVFDLDGAARGLDQGQGVHTFRVDEFRRPAFEVTARDASAGPHLVRDPATVSVNADYFAGGALGAAPVLWTVSQAETTYAPPNWPDFTFGEWVPWWFSGRGVYGDGFEGGYGRGFGGGYGAGFGGGLSDAVGLRCCGPNPNEQAKVERFEATTDAGGGHLLQIDLQGEAPDQPVAVTANAAITDVDRQQLAGTVQLLVHPARYYVGMRTDRTFVRAGEDLDVELVATTIDGTITSGREIDVTAARLEDRYEDGTYTEVPVDERTCSVTSGDAPVACTFRVEVGGRYRITAVTTDEDGGHQRSELTRWVSGATAIGSRSVEEENLTIVPDRATYAVGDSARLLVVSPFERGHGLVTVTHGDILSNEVFTLAEGSAVLDIPITAAMLAGIEVHITVDGSAVRLREDGAPDADLPPRPAVATGSVFLSVPPRTRTLEVTATPRDAVITPGGSTTLDIAVRAPDGSPAAGAEVAVIVADDAVLSLIGRVIADPAELFHAAQAANLRIERIRGTIVLRMSDQDGMSEATQGGSQSGDSSSAGSSTGGLAYDTAERASIPAPMLSATGQSEESQIGVEDTPIGLRSNFDPLALFAPAVVTGADGRASVAVTVPDNLTRYRIVALAVYGEDRFGVGESSLTARQPLLVRPAAPRFLNFGDRFDFPVTLQNQTDDDLEVEVVLQGANLAVEGPGDNAGGLLVTVPANDRVEVRLPAAADVAGTARYRVAAVSGALADAVVADFPVYTPVTTEAFATYGVLDGSSGGAGERSVGSHRLRAPTGVVPGFGGLEFSTSSTSLATLTDAVLYLERYPYQSADAYASRVLAIASLRDVLEAFAADGLGGRAKVDTTAREDLAALIGLQNDDGGFSSWQRGRPSDPYTSVQGAHALIAGRDAGYAVEAAAVERSLAYLRDIASHIPGTWDRNSRLSLRAYALHVRDLAGGRDGQGAARLFDEGDLPMDALAWLWPVLDDPGRTSEIDLEVHNRVTETPGAATFTTGYVEGAHLVLASDRRTDGLVLDALIRMRPNSDLIPKVVTGLIGNQRKGHWNNVQENAFILLALKRYFDTYEATTPDLVARAWLGNDYIAEHTYTGRSIDGQRSVVPMADLVAGGDRDLVVSDDGAGRLYYRLGLRYAPEDLTIASRDEGFVVDRVYEAIDDPDDVVRQGDGTWRIRAGANVRVRLTMVADSQRTNMALVDHLPAGLEAVNPAFATAPAIQAEQGDTEGGPASRSSWWGTWYDHQNLRDDRAEAFSNYLAAGTYEYVYVARATTPGTFVVPPTKAEEIYSPEVFGRSASDRVTIVDAAARVIPAA